MFSANVNHPVGDFTLLYQKRHMKNEAVTLRL